MITGTGNDYACGERGGPPRDRKAQAGELYILDLGPAYQGYFADNCRAISVDRRPTDAQLRAWEQILPVFELIPAHSQARQELPRAVRRGGRTAQACPARLNLAITWGTASGCFRTRPSI